MEEISFQLLPCQAIERLGLKRNDRVTHIRYKMTGILTKYKGRYYLLPQRARRAYSHGNFGR